MKVVTYFEKSLDDPKHSYKQFMKIQVDISVDAKTLKRQLTFQPSFPCFQNLLLSKHLRLI